MQRISDNNMKIVVMLTCHNRRAKTINCINGLSCSTADVHFIVVDDGSTDGTIEALEDRADVTLIKENGNMFYSGGMRRAMEYALVNTDADYYVLVNDDVVFYEGILDKLKLLKDDTVYVGAMKDSHDNCSYGGVRYYKGIHYNKVTPESVDRRCDTFNANYVVIPRGIFKTVPIMDAHYIHSLGDFDYGLSIRNAGYPIEVLDYYAGVCDNNTVTGTWNDRSLSRRERLRLKESVKGAPFKPWFYFLKKNFGLLYAVVYSITPYIRIIIG